jgi:hypothetical protein
MNFAINPGKMEEKILKNLNSGKNIPFFLDFAGDGR